jgi:hypothetical protein
LTVVERTTRRSADDSVDKAIYGIALPKDFLLDDGELGRSNVTWRIERIDEYVAPVLVTVEVRGPCSWSTGKDAVIILREHLNLFEA